MKAPMIRHDNYIIFEEKEVDVKEGESFCPSCKGHGKERRSYGGSSVTEKDYDTCCSCGGSGIVSSPGKPHTCPLRAGNIGPFKFGGADGKNVDRFTFFGNDLCCSYCGSIDYQGFKEIVALCLSDEKVTLEVNDHRDKIYLNRPWIRNAMVGAIKFKTAHLPDNWKEDIGPDLDKALKRSKQRYEARYQKPI